MPSLELPGDLFEMVELVVRPLWSRIVVVEVRDGELLFFVEATASFVHFAFGEWLTALRAQ